MKTKTLTILLVLFLLRVCWAVQGRIPDVTSLVIVGVGVVAILLSTGFGSFIIGLMFLGIGFLWIIEATSLTELAEQLPTLIARWTTMVEQLLRSWFM